MAGDCGRRPGFIGFAVGRTDFWQPLVDMAREKDHARSRRRRNCRRYQRICEIFERPASCRRSQRRRSQRNRQTRSLILAATMLAWRQLAAIPAEDSRSSIETAHETTPHKRARQSAHPSILSQTYPRFQKGELMQLGMIGLAEWAPTWCGGYQRRTRLRGVRHVAEGGERTRSKTKPSAQLLSRISSKNSKSRAPSG